MISKLLAYLIILQQIENNLLGEYLVDTKQLGLVDTYDKCDEDDFVCFGMNAQFDIERLDADCIQKRDCVGFVLVHHLSETKKFNFYLLTSKETVELIRLNIFHSNSSDRMSIEVNCTDFNNHRPEVQMNIDNYRLDFNTIPESEQPKDVLNLVEKDQYFCVWSSEENFFLNGIFKSEANYLYFDLVKRLYDIRLLVKKSNSDLNIRSISSARFIKSTHSTFDFINLLLSLNVVCLVTLLTAIFFYNSLFKF